MEPIQTLLAKIARQHLGIETLETRRCDRLDFHDVAVWCVADALHAAFAAGATSERRERATLDVHKLLAERRQVAIIWCVEDVQEERPDLNDDQSWEVLQRCERSHDCNYGFTWDLIRYVADDLFPAPGEGERP